ncbi:monovalent cation/H(+) antiporter subunit G [Pontibacter sp. CAU 1760]
MNETASALIMIKEVLSGIFILSGVLFMLISTIGLLRLPDFYIRMSAITKGATLGVGLILLGIGIYFNEPSMLLKVLAIVIFTFITTPVAAHVIGRTAVQQKIPFWKRTNLKEFKSYLVSENFGDQENRDKYKEEELMNEMKKSKQETRGGSDE